MPADPTPIAVDLVRWALAKSGLHPDEYTHLTRILVGAITTAREEVRAESAERIAALQRDAEAAAIAENANAADLRAARERIAALEALVQEARVTLGRVQATLEALPSPAAPPVAGPVVDLVAAQPPPTGDGDVWAELIADEPPGPIRDLMIARREQGIVKYGRPLGRDNGRDHVADAVQEALDGMAYAHAAGNGPARVLFGAALGALLPRTGGAS